MPLPLDLIFSALGVSGSAMFAGVMLTIGVTLGGYWKSLPSEGFLDWFSKNNHFIRNSTRLVMFPAIVGMAGSIWFNWTEGAERSWWIAAFGCVVAVLIITIAYEVPTNAHLAQKSVPLDRVRSTLNTWLGVHGVRILLATIASVLGIIAISLSHL